MEYICKVCNQKIEGNSHFWDEHRQKIADYFSQHEPRKTKTGEKVIFKQDIESYFNTDFNSLIERNSWAKQNPEEAKEYFLDLLIKRKKKKNWVYAPGQALLRLSSLPSILYFEKAFNLSFKEICKKLGFKIRYKNDKVDIDWSAPIDIIEDSREQKGFVFDKHIKSTSTKLSYGDYSLVENTKIVVERKSLGDASGTLSAGYDRFKRELDRAKEDEGYIVILVESSFHDFRGIQFVPQTKHVQASYEHLAKRVRDLYQEFDNFQIVFANGRKHAAKIAELVLKLGKKVKSTDIQYLIDLKKI